MKKIHIITDDSIIMVSDCDYIELKDLKLYKKVHKGYKYIYSKHKKTRVRENSQYKGVRMCWCNNVIRWKAILYKEQKEYSHICDTEEKAAVAYNVLAQLLYGDHASYNFVDIPMYDELFRELKELLQNSKPFRKSIIGQGKSYKKDKLSKYVGVTWDRSRCKWISKIRKDLKTIFIGRYENEVDAAKVYDRKALELYGNNARLNFL